MKLVVDQLWSFSSDRFDVPGDQAMLAHVAEDLREHARGQAPNDHWTTAGQADESMYSMLPHWVGSVGELPVSDPEAISRISGDSTLLERTVRFALGLDSFGIVPAEDTVQALADRHYRMMDLHSLTELLILAPYLAELDTSRIRVIEIGGGFGRLAEAMQLAYPGSVQHVLIDAVPSSLMYCFSYLRQRFPSLRVDYLEHGQTWQDVESSDLVIVPAWRSELLPEGSFDLGVNIASFQEMDLGTVDHYYRLLDTRVAQGGLVALHNSRDYVFKGPWNTPRNWDQLLKRRTPRSWTRDFPFELFRVRSDDRSASQHLHDYFWRTQDLAFFDSAIAGSIGVVPDNPEAASRSRMGRLRDRLLGR